MAIEVKGASKHVGRVASARGERKEEAKSAEPIPAAKNVEVEASPVKKKPVKIIRIKPTKTKESK